MGAAGALGNGVEGATIEVADAFAGAVGLEGVGGFEGTGGFATDAFKVVGASVVTVCGATVAAFCCVSALGAAGICTSGVCAFGVDEAARDGFVTKEAAA